MFIKYSISYYALFCLLVIITILVHPVFIIFVLGYSVFIVYRLNWVNLILMIVFTIAFVMIMHYPQSCSDPYLQGTIISQDDSSVVIQTAATKVKVYGNFTGFAVGDELEIKVSYFDIREPTNDNAFNYKHYLYSRGITNNAVLTNIISSQKHETMLQKLQSRFAGEDLVNSYASMFIIGVKDELINDYYQQLTNLSVVHLFALSGLHIHMLKGIIKKPLGFLLPERFLEYFCLVIIGFYIYIIPFNVSFLRAYLVMVLNTLFKKYLNRLDSLGIVALIMIYMNPYIIFNLSFIFSYFMYLLIIFINRHKYLNLLLYIGSIPIILTIQYRINLLSFILGVILTPLVSLLYQLLWLYTLFGSFFKPVTSLVITMLNNIIVFCEDFSIFINFMKPSLFFLLAFYFIYFKLLFKVNIKQKIYHEIMLLLSLMIMFYFKPYYQIYGQVVMIDVGQGDCFLIQQPFKLGNILIDTGGLKNTDLAEVTLVPYLRSIGVFELDYVFISHDDFDHSGAYDSLSEKIKIKETITTYQEKMTIGNVEIEMLKTPLSDDSNDSSLVFVATVNKLKYLFTGDISTTVEKQLVETYPDLKVDVLKVSHHGSNTATSALFLEKIKPRIALISCGKGNLYGHPHDDVIQRLHDYGVKVYRSDQMGMVKIVYYGNDNYIFQ